MLRDFSINDFLTINFLIVNNFLIINKKKRRNFQIWWKKIVFFFFLFNTSGARDNKIIRFKMPSMSCPYMHLIIYWENPYLQMGFFFFHFQTNQFSSSHTSSSIKMVLFRLLFFFFFLWIFLMQCRQHWVKTTFCIILKEI